MIQFVVIEGGVPPLLSVGLLEHLGASLDLVSNRLNFKKIGVEMKMTNLPTGHRAIPLVQWNGGNFPVPPAAKEQYRLQDNAFMKKPAVSSAYAKEESSESGFADTFASGLCTEQDAVESSVHDAAVPHVRDHFLVEDQVSSCVAHECSAHASGSTAPMGNVTNRSSAQYMEHAPRSATDAGTSGNRRLPQRWQEMVLRVFYTLETIRVNYFRLAVAERTQKSLASERQRYLTDPRQEPAKCLHPGDPLRRANQYATWTEGKGQVKNNDHGDLGASVHSSDYHAAKVLIDEGDFLDRQRGAGGPGSPRAERDFASPDPMRHMTQVNQLVQEDMQVDSSGQDPTSPDSQWSAVSAPGDNPNAGDLP